MHGICSTKKLSHVFNDINRLAKHSETATPQNSVIKQLHHTEMSPRKQQVVGMSNKGKF